MYREFDKEGSYWGFRTKIYPLEMPLGRTCVEWPKTPYGRKARSDSPRTGAIPTGPVPFNRGPSAELGLSVKLDGIYHSHQVGLKFDNER